MSRESSTPKWYDPCGIGYSSGAWSDAKNASSENSSLDLHFVEKIASQANVAQGRANSFKEKFAKSAFNMDVDRLHSLHKDQDYEWLPTSKMEKKWKQPVSRVFLETLKYEPTLLSVYTDLQKIAVGIEQIVWDEEDRGGELRDDFFDAQNQLNILLCEIHTAILEKGLKFGENVSRAIMREELRKHSNQTDMFIRNWIIYRDYMNMLEYVIEVFEHFKATLSRRESGGS